MLKHCTSSTTDLRARPIQSFAKEGDKLVRGPGEAEGNRKTSLVTTDQIATAFESPKLGRPVRYGFKPVAHRGRSQSLEPALPPSCPASPSLAHRSSFDPIYVTTTSSYSHILTSHIYNPPPAEKAEFALCKQLISHLFIDNTNFTFVH